MNPRARHLGWTAAGLFTAGVLGGWSAPALLHIGEAQANPEALAASSAAAPSSIAPGAAPNYHDIFAHNQAAVVSVTTVGETPVAESGSSPFDSGQDNPFAQLFRQLPSPPPDAQPPTRALGSGFIVSRDGVILTNAHVVNGARTVTVTLSDHHQYKARVLGADRTSDIAVLKIDAHDLPTVQLGNSDELAVGDYVMAIGAPFGLTESATAGIVSAKSRSLPDDGYMAFIQTDAAVNPGNSGGPLFNAAGAVVGINSQIYSNSGGYEGVAFAIPINYAHQVEEQIVQTGKVEHGRLGVQVQTVDQSLANSFGRPAPGGALVAKIEPDSAAAHAGLQQGDVILKYDGASIEDAAALSMRVNTTAPGEKATLVVWRHGKDITLIATVASADRTRIADNAAAATAEQTHLGLTVRPLSPDERDQTGVSGGLVVESAQGHAADAGVQRGDVLLAVDGTSISSVDQLRSAVHAEHGGSVALLIQRGNDRLYVPVDLG
jgi:serine protease Do